MNSPPSRALRAEPFYCGRQDLIRDPRETILAKSWPKVCPELLRNGYTPNPGSDKPHKVTNDDDDDDDNQHHYSNDTRNRMYLSAMCETWARLTWFSAENNIIQAVFGGSHIYFLCSFVLPLSISSFICLVRRYDL